MIPEANIQRVGLSWACGQRRNALSYRRPALTAGLRLPMGPEGRIRTDISVVDSDALCHLSYPGAVLEVYLEADAVARWPMETIPLAKSAHLALPGGLDRM